VFSGCIPVAAAGYKREANDCYRQLKEFRKWTSDEANIQVIIAAEKAGKGLEVWAVEALKAFWEDPAG
jgi:hypothetical protein